MRFNANRARCPDKLAPSELNRECWQMPKIWIVARNTCAIAMLCILPSLFQLSAQENPTSAKPPCIAEGEPVYHGVKPPQPQPNKKDNAAPDMRGPFSIQLLVNSEGRVCDTQVISAKDRSSAEKAAHYISEHWTFKPATKQGKPVAVKFTTNFGPR
jgi:hypothetical protein